MKLSRRVRSAMVVVSAIVLGSGCQTELERLQGEIGSVAGTWIGTGTDDDTGEEAIIVLWLEQRQEQVYGAASYWTNRPVVVPNAPMNAECIIEEGLIVDGGLTFRFANDLDIETMISLALDPASESLTGRWAGRREAISREGSVRFERVAWLARRSTGNFPRPLGCGPGPLPECNDGLDNDGDGSLDVFDDDCDGLFHNNESPQIFSCENGFDDDGDGLTDDEDPSCFGNYLSEVAVDRPCFDGWDNDGDGFTDLDDPGCGGAAEAASEVEPMCEDGVDNDGDGATDGDDPDCADGWRENPRAMECYNNYDDDGDGLVDADDPGCYGNPQHDREAWENPCRDDWDNDGDGAVDLEDSDCLRFYPRNEDGRISDESDCQDGLDNDGDGYTDLEELGCREVVLGIEGISPPPRSWWNHLIQCHDGVDNDGDGLVDGDDPSCLILDFEGAYSSDVPLPSTDFVGYSRTFESAPPCVDGVDNDGDGLIDLEDRDCRYLWTMSEASPCHNGIDDDLDWQIDGDDPACQGNPEGREDEPACSDGVDNDGDGLVDLDDPDCLSAHDHHEAPRCSDGVDNDGDRLYDLADPECHGDPTRDSET